MKKVSNKFLVMFAIVFGLIAGGCSSDNDIEIIDDGPTIPPVGEVTELNGSLQEDRTLDASETYNLTGVYSLEAGATLTIPAGTNIVADADLDNNEATNVYIVVQKGAMIDIQGTSSAPVIMSSANGESGSWGGLVIAGNALSTAVWMQQLKLVELYTGVMMLLIIPVL